MKKFAFLFAFVFAVLAVSAQTVSITGTQKAGAAGINADLKCNPVKIDQTMYIFNVEGDCAGFWISTKNGVLITFESMEKALNYVLKPGVYYVFPNLRQGQATAKVTVHLKTKS
jgi:hypothetical protein